jgi:tripartite ATP-independent transporter DctP family solute receptor
MKKLVTALVFLVIAAAFVFAGAQSEKPEIPEAVTPTAAAAKYVLKLAHADSTNIYTSRKHTQCVAFANLVNARSGGQIEVQVFGAGALGAEREYVEGIQSGIVQAGIASGVMGSFFPSAMVTDIPYLFPSAAVAWEVLDGPVGDELREKFLKDTGVRCLAFAEVGFRNFTNDVRPIRKPEDLKGLKIRVMETPLFVTLVRSLGAIPTPIAWTETYTALQTGVVDGEENPISVILVANFPEVQKYVTLDGHVYGVDWFLINEKFFQSLPADLQYIVLDSAKISSGVGRGVQQALGATGIARLREAGMEVYVPTEQQRELFKQATQGPVIEWLKTKMDASIINKFLKEVDRVVGKEKAELK